MDDAALLSAYDQQLRGAAEMAGTARWISRGPLGLGHYADGRGFVSYRSLGDPTRAELKRLIRDTVAYFAQDPRVPSFEWKTRGHDDLPDLHHLLTAHGLAPPEDRETVMIGEAGALAVEVPVPQGVRLRRVTDRADIEAAAEMQGSVFGDTDSVQARVESTMTRLDQIELWVAETAGEVVSAGLVEPVPGTEFAGIWGGATLPQWRGRGIYRALTAKRAKAALRAGKTFINSDSTEFSRPILQRSGFRRVTTTTPYIWSR